MPAVDAASTPKKMLTRVMAALLISGAFHRALVRGSHAHLVPLIVTDAALIEHRAVILSAAKNQACTGAYARFFAALRMTVPWVQQTLERLGSRPTRQPRLLDAPETFGRISWR